MTSCRFGQVDKMWSPSPTAVSAMGAPADLDNLLTRTARPTVVICSSRSASGGLGFWHADSDACLRALGVLT
jgi:hypothetical protein